MFFVNICQFLIIVSLVREDDNSGCLFFSLYDFGLQILVSCLRGKKINVRCRQCQCSVLTNTKFLLSLKQLLL